MSTTEMLTRIDALLSEVNELRSLLVDVANNLADRAAELAELVEARREQAQ